MRVSTTTGEARGVIAAAVLCVAVGAGCATATKPATCTLNAPVTIHVLADTEVWAAWEANGGAVGQPSSPIRPYGFCKPSTREIWVRWGSEKGLPDFECVGHEVWHLVVGDFHADQTAWMQTRTGP